MQMDKSHMLVSWLSIHGGEVFQSIKAHTEASIRISFRVMKQLYIVSQYWIALLLTFSKLLVSVAAMYNISGLNPLEK